MPTASVNTEVTSMTVFELYTAVIKFTKSVSKNDEILKW
jgi:hypothetical protein